MATSTLYFTGKCQWAKVRTPDTKFNPEGEYKIDLFLDKENLEKFNQNKLQLKLRHNENDDNPYVTFKRPDKQLIKGEIVQRGAPEVIDADEKPVTKDIGNGSTVTCKIIVYDTPKGKGHRLEKIRVDELVEFNKDAPQDGMPF